MKFESTKLEGAFKIDLEPLKDERGFFATSFCQKEFQDYGLRTDLVQCSISFNHKAGTLRGMHYQVAPKEQTKLVRCTAGAIYDVIIDLRLGSPTYKQWEAIELTGSNRRMFYIPAGFAHGFQTLQDNTEVFYQMCDPFAPESAHGVRWSDPAFNIDWPSVKSRIILPRDDQYPDFDG